MYLAIRKCKRYNESWAVFQSHTYSRTFNLLDEFVEALSDFDNIINTILLHYKKEIIKLHTPTPISPHTQQKEHRENKNKGAV